MSDSDKIEFKKIPINDLQIPEDYDLRALPLELSDAQLETITILLWHQYILHDEISGALKFIEDAPYRIKHSKKICECIKITKKMSAHMGNIEEEALVNTAREKDDSIIETEIIAFEDIERAQKEPRFQWIMDRLPVGSKVIDFGPYDGHFSNKWAAKGIHLTGIDLCEYALVIARDTAQKHNLSAQYINAYFCDVHKYLTEHSFDIAVSTEAYEHLKDPVQDLLIPARRMLVGNGKMLLSTPHGAVFRGKYISYGHPWNALHKAPSWIEGMQRHHIIAPTVWTVLDSFRKAGFWVYDCKVCPAFYQVVPEQGSIFVEAYANPPIVNPGKEFIVQGWNSQAIELANNLAAAGHSVKAFVQGHEECVLGFVEYRNLDKLYLEDDNTRAIRIQDDEIIFYKNGAKIQQKIVSYNTNTFLNDLKKQAV
jgi:2-polyprenyl-3-methyl-5-hydroxy-6-metoxy-1,4-benzoquinol methylase